MAFKKDQFIVDPRACIIPKGASFGDRRFRYKNFWCLSPSEKDYVRRAYPHNAPGIPDSAYAYPIDASGKMPKGRASRTLIWSRKRTMKKVNRDLSGGRTRRRRRR